MESQAGGLENRRANGGMSDNLSQEGLVLETIGLARVAANAKRFPSS